ncbi:MAG: phenylalanine--tRNA ligase subunit alpha [Vicinamibacterales bacterium]
MDYPELQRDLERDIASVKSLADVRAVRDRYLSRKGGRISVALKALGSAPADERRALGQALNGLKRYAEEQLGAAERARAAVRPPADAVDVTLPGREPLVGHLHPLTLLRDHVEAIFQRLGFLVIEGPELEDEYHNFEALNMPAEHPARDMQDTLYLSAPVPAADGGRAATLLRTHTSGMQIRYMETHPPPVRLVAPGRVYRRDGLDLTHSPMFTQVEGLVVDEGVTLADLKGTLIIFARELFGAARGTRFRPSFFPYTEPSGELDISCAACGGSGRGVRAGASAVEEIEDSLNGAPCAMCKGTGWIEVLGSGMVHPAVFEAVGYDHERYTGFAFGVGIERLALLKWGVEDIRLFYENDLRFLEQFPL